LFSTLITLVLIPTVYRLFNAFGNGWRRIFTKKTTDQVEEKIAG